MERRLVVSEELRKLRVRLPVELSFPLVHVRSRQEAAATGKALQRGGYAFSFYPDEGLLAEVLSLRAQLLSVEPSEALLAIAGGMGLKAELPRLARVYRGWKASPSVFRAFTRFALIQ